MILVSKLEREEYFNVKKIFSAPDECIRTAMYTPFELENPTGKYLT